MACVLDAGADMMSVWYAVCIARLSDVCAWMRSARARSSSASPATTAASCSAVILTGFLAILASLLGSTRCDSDFCILPASVSAFTTLTFVASSFSHPMSLPLTAASSSRVVKSVPSAPALRRKPESLSSIPVKAIGIHPSTMLFARPRSPSEGVGRSGTSARRLERTRSLPKFT